MNLKCWDFGHKINIFGDLIALFWNIWTHGEIYPITFQMTIQNCNLDKFVLIIPFFEKLTFLRIFPRVDILKCRVESVHFVQFPLKTRYIYIYFLIFFPKTYVTLNYCHQSYYKNIKSYIEVYTLSPTRSTLFILKTLLVEQSQPTLSLF